MEICSNCFKQLPQAYPFCPHCGYPHNDIAVKQCANGHIIYETYRQCPFCYQPEYQTEEIPGTQTELLDAKTNIKNPQYTEQIEKNIKNDEPGDDKTVFETDTNDKTVLEGETDDKTRVETKTGFPDKTVMEDEAEKTIMDEDMGEPPPPFFAWLVYIDEEGKPLQDIRLTRQKTIIGKSADADIQLKDDFASKLHAVIHFEAGKFFISDLGSTNFTWLNEKKIMNGELFDGNIIRIGHQNIIFKRVRRNI